MWGFPTLLDPAAAATEMISRVQPKVPEVIKDLTESYSTLFFYLPFQRPVPHGQLSFFIFYFSGLYIQGMLISTFPLQRSQPSSSARRATRNTPVGISGEILVNKSNYSKTLSGETPLSSPQNTTILHFLFIQKYKLLNSYFKPWGLFIPLTFLGKHIRTREKNS